MTDDDRIPAVELTQWRVGRVLTADDIAMLRRCLDEADAEIETQAELYAKARREVLHELGGATLVDAFERADEEECAIAIQNAIEKFYKRRVEIEAKRKATMS